MRVPRPSPGEIRGAAAPGHPFCGGGARRCLVRGTRLRALVAVDRRVLATACNLDGSPTSTLLWGLVGPLLAAMLASRRRYGPGAPAVSSRSWRHCASGGTSLRSCGRTGHGASRQVRGCALDRDDVSCYGLNADPLISKEASAAGSPDGLGGCVGHHPCCDGLGEVPRRTHCQQGVADRLSGGRPWWFCRST